jgi:UDP-N-acetyl-D-glucosamine dehydrogenase
VPADVTLVECTDDVVAAADMVVVLTDHDAIDWPLLDRHAADVLDTRNRLTAPGVDRL